MHELSSAQRRAVEHGPGPVLVLSGPGGGKTRVITTRIIHLLNQDIDPRNIAAVTFTKKAANEMKHRLGSAGTDVRVGTLHSLCLQLLREILNREVPVVDEDKAIEIVGDILSKRKLCHVDPRSVIRDISVLKSHMIEPDQARRFSRGKFEESLCFVYEDYEKILDESGAVDFDDILWNLLKTMDRNRKIQEKVSNTFEHILVDEYQDINTMQMRVLDVLAKSGNIFVVGDSNQSIYRFRGADPSSVNLFVAKYKPFVATLTVNYRSTRNLVRAASDFIVKGRFATRMELTPASVVDGPPVMIHSDISHESEARWIVSKVKGMDQSKVAILARTYSALEPVRHAFETSGIKTTVIADQSKSMEATNEGEGLKLMTIHAAKGLEFDTVFIVNMEDGVIPHRLSINDKDDMAEERRLAYVAMTRARNNLYLTRSVTRNLRPCEPSRFLKDIPRKYVIEV